MIAVQYIYFFFMAPLYICIEHTDVMCYEKGKEENKMERFVFTFKNVTVCLYINKNVQVKL